MKRILYTRQDGGVSIVIPCISQDDPEGTTEDEALARALAKDVPVDAKNVTILDASAIPSDRSKRYAWRLQGGAIVVDPTVPEPERVHKARRLDELKSKRRAGSPLNPLEQQELLDLLAGV